MSEISKERREQISTRANACDVPSPRALIDPETQMNVVHESAKQDVLDLLNALEAAEAARDSALAEVVRLKAQRDESESLLASTTDLLNSWAREYEVHEAPNEKGIKGVVNRLWDKCALLRTERDHLKHAAKGGTEA